MYKLLQKLAIKSGRLVVYAIELFLIDFTYGKSKYRKRGARLRPIIHRTYNRRTVIVQQPVPLDRQVNGKE